MHEPWFAKSDTVYLFYFLGTSMQMLDVAAS